MLNRRQIMLASIAAGAAMNGNDANAKAAQPSTPVNFDLPAGACDCHTHIHGDPAKFPFFSGRVYTPEPASPEEMAALHKALHIERVVIVTPSVYGTDNSATLFGIKARGWHIQLYTSLAMITALKDAFAASPVPIVFDHFGGAQAALGVEQPGFSDLLDLVKSGNAYVKISGAYRASKLGPDYQDCVPLAKMLIAANADRIVWGTDWPHPDSVTPPGRQVTEVTPLFQIDDGRLLNQLPVWAPDAAIRKKILVD